MPLPPPTLDQLRRIAGHYRMNLSDADLARYAKLIENTLPPFDRVDAIADLAPAPTYPPRDPGFRPSSSDNPCNAFAWRCSVKTTTHGPLHGKTVALKDTVSLAGIPLSCGTGLLDGFVPSADATIVTRILAAGGEIVGKAACEPLCMSDYSHAAHTGPVTNPHDASRSAGGSSSGSGALVACGAVDVAIGGDQGGSIRTPAHWCGCYGLKPTYGLVPYTGIMSSEHTFDHAGPMAMTVINLAMLLNAIAGPDGVDPRQAGVPRTPDYTANLHGGIEGMRVGVLAEGFGRGGSDAGVDAAVRAAADGLREAGAVVLPVNVPWHRDGVHLWTAIGFEGMLDNAIRGNGHATNAGGLFDPALVAFFGDRLRTRAAELPTPAVLVTLLGEHVRREYHGRHYAKARNGVLALRRAYDDALSGVDVLVMPTNPFNAPPLPTPGAAEPFAPPDRSSEPDANTCPFDLTGHPAISIPVGLSRGMPVGMMAVARHNDDAALLRLAATCESLYPPPRAGGLGMAR